MKKIIFTFLIFLLPSLANADYYDIVSEGFHYNLFVEDCTAAIIKTNIRSGEVVMPSHVDYYGKTYTVTTIEKEVFKNCSKITSVVLPSSLTTIRDEAFEDCSQIASLVLPPSLTTIGQDAFKRCSKLTSIIFPSSVTSIGREAFCETGLEDVVFNNAAVCIGPWAFLFTPWENSLPDGLNYVGKIAYKYKGEMPANTTIVLKEDTKSIAGAAFDEYHNLCGITIPEGIVYIGGFAFDSTNIRDVYMPNSVKGIGEYCFYYSALENIHLSTSLTEISNGAFKSCENLKSVVLPSGIIYIEGEAFGLCSGLESVTIPDGIEFINYGAFYGCPKLKDFYSWGVTPPPTYVYESSYKYYIFMHSDIEKSVLHVPSSALSDYSNTYPWNQFGSIVALTETDPHPTGIAPVKLNDTIKEPAPMFNLSGQRVGNDYKGLVIKDGKKFVNK